MEYIDYITRITKLGYETGRGNGNAFSEIFGDNDGRPDHEWQKEKDEKALKELEEAEFATEQDIFWEEIERNGIDVLQKDE